jgi:glycine C-acetyltransferase
MNEKFVERLRSEIEEIKASGLYKNERIISSSQGAEITVGGRKGAELLRQ